MSAANFPAELGDELVYEGGFVNDPADPGGVTDFGITLATYSHWLGRPASIAELRVMDDAVKAAIYRAGYWNMIQGDALPSGVDLITFDGAVNGGPKRAAEMLQEAVGAVADGMIGPKTLAAVLAAPASATVASISKEREAFYRGLPTFPHFGNGWLNRLADVTTKAQALAA